MGLIGIALLVIMVISAVLLVLVVLVQDDQGEGIGGIFGGGSNTAFGSRSGNVLTRFTAVMAAIFLVSVFALAWISRTPAAGNVLSKARQQALSESANQSWWVQAPAAGTSPSTAPAGTGPAAPAPASGTSPAGGTAPTGAAPAGAAPASTGTPSPSPASSAGGQ